MRGVKSLLLSKEWGSHHDNLNPVNLLGASKKKTNKRRRKFEKQLILKQSDIELWRSIWNVGIIRHEGSLPFWPPSPFRQQETFCRGKHTRHDPLHLTLLCSSYISAGLYDTHSHYSGDYVLAQGAFAFFWYLTCTYWCISGSCSSCSLLCFL